jgi:hypothetical protein
MNGTSSGLEATFKEQIGALGLLADPEVVTQTFATNYFQFSVFTDKDKNRLEGTDPRVQKAREEIEKHPAFIQQFHSKESRGSFKAMIEDGGTDHFFQELRNQALESRRKEFLERRKSERVETLKALIKEARPETAGYLEQRQRELMAWKNMVESALVDNTTQEIGITALSSMLRQILNVDANVLKPVPLNLADGPRSRESALSFWAKQFQTWRDDKSRRMRGSSSAPLCGIKDEVHLSRLLHYLVEAVPMEELRQWLVEHFGNVTSEENADNIRRFMAIKMTKALTTAAAGKVRAHRPTSEIEAELTKYADHETAYPYNYKYSPHYCAFIEPFLNRLVEIAGQTPAGARPKQPGDDELLALLNSHPDAGL